MLKKLEKLEENLNKKLVSLGGGLQKLWLALVPSFVFKRWFQTRVLCKTLALAAKSWLIETAKKSAAWIVEQYKKINSVSVSIQAFPIKKKALEGIGNFKNFLIKTPLKNHAELITKLMIASLDKTMFVFGKLKNPQVLIATSAMLMIFFGTYGVYVSGQNIYMQEWGSRAPASQDQYLNRPAYLKYPKRTLKVFNVKIPIYVESVMAVQSVTVDFTVRTNTRFAKQFLEEYEYKLKDYFFMTTEPVLSSFPLEDEGKSVLKEKIQYELNTFLKEEKVEGEVVEVDIIFIIGS